LLRVACHARSQRTDINHPNAHRRTLTQPSFSTKRASSFFPFMQRITVREGATKGPIDIICMGREFPHTKTPHWSLRRTSLGESSSSSLESSSLESVTTTIPFRRHTFYQHFFSAAAALALAPHD
jgi:hypothetical protein